MIAFVLAWLLAATAVVDTTVRIPGTTLRFGTESARFGAAQGFAPSTVPVRGGREAREGAVRFFGVEGMATLQFENRRLVEAGFVIEQASPRQISYIEDDLVRQGYHQRCTEKTVEHRLCDWSGRARLQLEVTGSTVVASVQPPRSIFATEAGVPDSPTPSHTLPIAGEVPIYPDTLTLEAAAQGRPYPAVVSTPERGPFPEAARSAGVQGIVFVLALVDTTGDVMEAEIRRGIAELNEAALPLARGYVFEPLIVDGRTVRYWIEVPIRFILR